MLYLAYIVVDLAQRATFQELVATLNRDGLEVSSSGYTSAHEATTALPSERPDVVFIDIHNGGLDLVRLLRAHPLCHNTIFIGMAEDGSGSDCALALAAGCHDFVTEPLTVPVLRSIILRRFSTAALR